MNWMNWHWLLRYTRRTAYLVLLSLVLCLPVSAQDEEPAAEVEAAPAEAAEAEAAPAETTGDDAPQGNTAARRPPTGVTRASGENPLAPAVEQQAARLISDALQLGEGYESARAVVVRGAAGLLPRLSGSGRDALVQRWLKIAGWSGVDQDARTTAYASFFDTLSYAELDYGRRLALTLPQAAGRAGALIQLSEKAEPENWAVADELASLALRAARAETSPRLRARALTYLAIHTINLNPETSAEAIRQASSHIRLLAPSAYRDSLMADLAGATAAYDVKLARMLSEAITVSAMRKNAESRIALQEVSQATVTGSTADRIAAIAKSASRYDTSAIPILLQLPPQAETLKALSDALPPLKPGASPALSVPLLERIWAFTSNLEPSVQRDELQSRLARHMVLHDVWRGRAWGQSLAWPGGRRQVARFLDATLAQRAAPFRAAQLHEQAQRSMPRALATARELPPAARAEALLLLAGQIMGARGY